MLKIPKNPAHENVFWITLLLFSVSFDINDNTDHAFCTGGLPFFMLMILHPNGVPCFTAGWGSG